MGSARRQLGYTEDNWCLALDGGTGVTVAAFLFGLPQSEKVVQAAVTKLLSAKPFLASQIVSDNKQLFFELGHKTVPVEKLPNPIVKNEAHSSAELWLQIVDWEMNILFPSTKPVPIFQVHLYSDLPEKSCLVVLRLHAGAADMNCLSPVGSAFLNCLKEVVQKEKSGENIEELFQKVTLDEGVVHNFAYDKAMENSVPKGAADKSFWARGTDVVGYGLVSRTHAYLPFKNTKEKRQSRLIRGSLSKGSTDRLLKACKENGTDLYGALHAAGLKAVASFKNVGKRGESYGVAVLHNCRPLLDPKLPEDALGFYQAPLLKTTHTTENHDYWKLAAQLTKDFQDAIKNRKHFTDMGSLNMFMIQAINHPNLTPFGTLRTALLSITYEPVIQTTPVQAADLLQLKDYVNCSSTHGVGPCLAIFHSLRDEALHASFVYNEPLFSGDDVETIVNRVFEYLKV